MIEFQLLLENLKIMKKTRQIENKHIIAVKSREAFRTRANILALVTTRSSGKKAAESGKIILKNSPLLRPNVPSESVLEKKFGGSGSSSSYVDYQFYKKPGFNSSINQDNMVKGSHSDSAASGTVKAYRDSTAGSTGGSNSGNTGGSNSGNTGGSSSGKDGGDHAFEKFKVITKLAPAGAVGLVGIYKDSLNTDAETVNKKIDRIWDEEYERRLEGTQRTADDMKVGREHADSVVPERINSAKLFKKSIEESAPVKSMKQVWDLINNGS